MKFPLKIIHSKPLHPEVIDADGNFVCVTKTLKIAERIVAALTEQEDAGM